MPALAWLANLDFAGSGVTEEPPGTPGLEYTLPHSQTHYTMQASLAHYAMPESRQHFTIQPEDR